jgi:UDP:flavonoid glycosyltransferase YjiC (YdhE family)
MIPRLAERMYFYVGSLLGEIHSNQADAGFDPKRRYVFAYLGTGSVTLDSARQILPRVFPVSGQLCCLVGAQSIEKTTIIEGVEFRPYVPVEALVPYCDWTLCHSGQNTIIQSLRSAVPLLLFPGPIFERRYNACKVVEAKAGLMGELNQFTSGWFEHAFSQHNQATENASGLAQRIQAYKGASAVITALEKWNN